MRSFHYNSQTAMFFGRNCIQENGAFFREHGARAVVFTTLFPAGHVNLGLEDIRVCFDGQGIEYMVVDNVSTDPPAEMVAELSAQVRGFGAEFFIAVGGGSAIDTAKAVALLMQFPAGADPYQVFWGPDAPSHAIRSEVRLPLFAVPTTAGTGAEVTPFAVLTRADIHTKRMMYYNAYPTAAFLDSRYIADSPDFLMHSGAIDALAHGIESYVHRDATPMGRMLAEYGFRLFSRFRERLADGGLTPDDLDDMLLAAFVQGMACMQSSTTVPHGLGYALSGEKRVPHGLACGVFLGTYMKAMGDRALAEGIVRQCGFDDCGAFADYCDALACGDLDISVTPAEIESWTDNFMRTQTIRLETDPDRLSREDIKRLYTNALHRFIRI